MKCFQLKKLKLRPNLGILGDLLTSENGSLDSGSISNSFIGVDGLVEVLAVEEVRDQLLDLGDPGGTSDQDDVMDGGLVHLGITERFLNRFKGTSEEVGTKLFETGPEK